MIIIDLTPVTHFTGICPNMCMHTCPKSILLYKEEAAVSFQSSAALHAALLA